MYKKVLIATLLVLACFAGRAQRAAERADSVRRWESHLSAGSSVAFGFGRAAATQWVAPRLEYRAGERLTLHGGFVAVGSLLGDRPLQGLGARSLAPRRQGTRLAGAMVGAEYQVNDRLWIWGSVAHVAGQWQALWLDGALPVGTTVLNGGFAYESERLGTFLMHFRIVHDHYGNAALGLLGHPWYGAGVPDLELYSGPWLY